MLRKIALSWVESMMTRTNDTPSEIIARRFLKQAEWCEKLGSRLYSQLLREAAADVRGLGVCWAVLQGHHADSPGSALALRFLGAVHRLVLEGKSSQLAACYPSMGGDAGCNELWPRFQKFVGEHETELRRLVHLPVQTNEVSRCAALLGGFLTVSRRTGLPLRLLEMGASAGLLLRWGLLSLQRRNRRMGRSRFASVYFRCICRGLARLQQCSKHCRAPRLRQFPNRPDCRRGETNIAVVRLARSDETLSSACRCYRGSKASACTNR